MKFILTFVLFVSVTSAFSQSTTQQKKDQAAIDAVIKAAKVVSAADLSCRTASDCTAVAIGSRACGGPSSYMISSKNNDNAELVTLLASKSGELEEAFNLKYQIFSICVLTMPPMPNCLAKKCN